MSSELSFHLSENSPNVMSFFFFNSILLITFIYVCVLLKEDNFSFFLRQVISEGRGYKICFKITFYVRGLSEGISILEDSVAICEVPQTAFTSEWEVYLKKKKKSKVLLLEVWCVA